MALAGSQPLTIAALERWVLFGATWTVAEISAEHVLVQLCSCTGEPVERHETRDPAVIAYVRDASDAAADPAAPEG
ncbi:MAG: hypothetical protein M3022_10785 [Actinomycetota bacterium]|nr:hypothetical protein [Actinomycetota bacterium]